MGRSSNDKRVKFPYFYPRAHLTDNYTVCSRAPIKHKKSAKKSKKSCVFFWRYNFLLYLCTRNQLEMVASSKHPAEIAQLVEHNLAKVGVASSSLVFRSKSKGLEKSKPFLFSRFQTRKRLPSNLGARFCSTNRTKSNPKNCTKKSKIASKN